jgi:Uri superfamily endonuclease
MLRRGRTLGRADLSMRLAVDPWALPFDRGVYVAVFHLRTRRRLAVGRLGRFDLPPGLYFYVGSAQRHLRHRLARHGRPDKPRRWHIDYLAAEATLLGFYAGALGRDAEPRLADALAARYEQPVPGFGASDSPAASHLFHRPVPPPQ